MHKKFGNLVRKLRNDKKLTATEFIKKIDNKISASYLTKIEIHGEIPSVKLICKMSEILDCDKKTLLTMAKKEKLDKVKKTLNERYK